MAKPTKEASACGQSCVSGSEFYKFPHANNWAINILVKEILALLFEVRHFIKYKKQHTTVLRTSKREKTLPLYSHNDFLHFLHFQLLFYTY